MKFLRNLKQLILFDIFGASITTILLLFVVKRYNQFFGVQPEKTNMLAIMALSICCFGFVSLFIDKRFWKQLLFILASLNIIYCFITAWMLIPNNSISIYGILYFSIEIAIILTLAFFEIKMARRIS